MPSSIATLLTVLVVLALVARRWFSDPDASTALWLPVLWLIITGSRFVSQWMSLGGAQDAAYDEGSPIDAIYFGALIFLGLVVLLRRNVRVGDVVRRNAWLLVFLGYGLISILWSDYPFIAFKRWTKAMGHPIMALVILTDPDPVRALKIVLERCAFVLMPFSVLLIKYFPEYGKSFDAYSGTPVVNGVGLTKNSLGYICMVSGLFFVWQLFQRDTGRTQGSRFAERLVAASMLAAALWLLRAADSVTSILALAVGTVTMVLIYTGLVSGRALTRLLVFGILFAWLLDYVFGVYDQVLLLLGRDATLTDRTLLWRDVFALQDNPYFGTGFESFWLGPRLEVLWQKWWWQPNQAHNGYIETYLNLGYVGVFLLFAMLLSAYARIRESFLAGSELAPFRLAVLVAIILFNFTEAAFKGVHFMWTMFYIVAMEYHVSANLAVEHLRGSMPHRERERHMAGEKGW